jgi:hypothetical protein
LSGLTTFYCIRGFRGLGALSNERGKDLGPDLVRVEWFRSKAEFSSPPQPQHLGREAEMSQLQVFQL